MHRFYGFPYDVSDPLFRQRGTFQVWRRTASTRDFRRFFERDAWSSIYLQATFCEIKMVRINRHFDIWKGIPNAFKLYR